MKYNQRHTTSAARGSAVNWINAGNPIEKNSRVKLFLRFGRVSPLLLSLLSPLGKSKDFIEVIQRRQFVESLLLPMFRVCIHVDRDSERPLTPRGQSDGNKHTVNSNKRDGATPKARKKDDRAIGIVIFIHRSYRCHLYLYQCIEKMTIKVVMVAVKYYYHSTQK